MQSSEWVTFERDGSDVESSWHVQKHFSVLLREGDTLARRVLDDELAALTMSLTHGPPMKFDVMAGLSANGNAFYGAGRGAGLEEAF